MVSLTSESRIILITPSADHGYFSPEGIEKLEKALGSIRQYDGKITIDSLTLEKNLTTEKEDQIIEALLEKIRNEWELVDEELIPKCVNFFYFRITFLFP
jgi:hypothetical protein